MNNNELTSLRINYNYYKANNLNIPNILSWKLIKLLKQEYNKEFSGIKEAPEFNKWLNNKLN